jgi:phosphoglycolate phosphatase-like HAD superfamily hydrolase
MYLITATPKKEIDEILDELKISFYFKEVFGAPSSKIEAIQIVLDSLKIKSKNAIMIGDSLSDYNAAIICDIEFVLRKTQFNLALQKKLNCIMIEGFDSE